MKKWQKRIGFHDCNGYTLVETVVAWTVFLMLLLSAIKGFDMAAYLSAEGSRIRSFSQEAYAGALLGKTPDRESKEAIFFQMGDQSGVVSVRLREFQAPPDYGEKEQKQKVIFRTIAAEPGGG